jgi:hypothetical protein
MSSSLAIVPFSALSHVAGDDAAAGNASLTPNENHQGDVIQLVNVQHCLHRLRSLEQSRYGGVVKLPQVLHDCENAAGPHANLVAADVIATDDQGLPACTVRYPIARNS